MAFLHGKIRSFNEVELLWCSKFHSNLCVWFDCLFLSNNLHYFAVVRKPVMFIWGLWLKIVLLVVSEEIELKMWCSSIQVLDCVWKKMPIVRSGIMTITKQITSNYFEWGGKLMSGSPDIFLVEFLKACNKGTRIPTDLVKSVRVLCNVKHSCPGLYLKWTGWASR